MNRKRLPDEMVEQMMGALAEGFSPEYIASQLGVTPQTVRNYRRRYHEGWEPAVVIWTREMEDALIEAVENGTDVYKLNLFGKTNLACLNAYYKALKKRGLKRVIRHVTEG